MEKLIYIMAGYRTSLHYHEVRDEKLRVLLGAGSIDFERGKRSWFKKGSKIHIKPGTVHSFIARENVLLHETSTPHPNDVIRVKDFYKFRLK
jgi:mannose-6-phosphate isomerase-like protein (cupin superfamily)